MRPVAIAQDGLRHPLNELFGTRSNVRLLRVLATEVDGPLSAADAARRAGLTVPGAQKALTSLTHAGFLTRVGGGRRYLYEIRSSDPLMKAAAAVFQAEKNRYDALLHRMKQAVESLAPPPHAAWIKQVPQNAGDPLTISLLHSSRDLSPAVRELRKRLSPLESEFNLTIELEGYTRADLLDLDLAEVTLFYGFLPSLERPSVRQPNGPLTHAGKERQLDELSENLPKLIEQDPSLLRRAKDHVDRLLQENHGTAARDLAEWRYILERYPMDRLLQFLASSSERSKRLRQSNPFFAVLSRDEKARLIGGAGDGHDPGPA